MNYNHNNINNKKDATICDVTVDRRMGYSVGVAGESWGKSKEVVDCCCRTSSSNTIQRCRRCSTGVREKGQAERVAVCGGYG